MTSRTESSLIGFFLRRTGTRRWCSDEVITAPSPGGAQDFFLDGTKPSNVSSATRSSVEYRKHFVLSRSLISKQLVETKIGSLNSAVARLKLSMIFVGSRTERRRTLRIQVSFHNSVFDLGSCGGGDVSGVKPSEDDIIPNLPVDLSGPLPGCRGSITHPNVALGRSTS